MELWAFIRRFLIVRKVMAGHKPLLLALFATLSLLMAYWAEYKLHIIPCELCWYQRYILIGVIILSLLSALCGALYPFARLALWGSFFLNSYQIGVEQKWWKAPSVCAQKIEEKHLETEEQKAQAIRDYVYKQPFSPCDKITWRIFQIPATVWFEGALLLVLLATKR